MPSAALLFNLFRDCMTPGVPARVPEPDLVMTDPAQAEAFRQAGSPQGILAHTYLYHAIQASAFIAPGAKVLDLGCGPANQLSVLARINPEANFVGLDASPGMLELARAHLRDSGLANVSLCKGNMLDLAEFESGSFDAVLCCMSLHHLPDAAALQRCMDEIGRVLKPGGGLYIVDFGRLSRYATQHFFAHEKRAVQPELFTQDYFNSLRAAFCLSELREAAGRIEGAVLRRTFLVPFLVVIHAGPCYALGAGRQAAVSAAYEALEPGQRDELRDLSRFFGHGGYPLAWRPWPVWML